MSNDIKIDSNNDLEEGYWKSLLTEGEHASSVPPDSSFMDAFETSPTVQSDSCSDGRSNPNDWDELRQKMDNDIALHLKVVGYNRGGLLVEWHSLRGFVPASQLINFPETSLERDRRTALIERVGDVLDLRIIELDYEKNRLILSERAAQVAPGTRDYILGNLKTGDMVSGTITNLCDFGAFVDLGGIEGLVHISELSWGRVGHPSDILTRGEQVNACVLEVDPGQGRVALSIKRLSPDPWATVETRYHIGDIVEGRITNVVDFGAFTCIETGLEGLIHFSELAEGHFLHPRNVVSEGDTVRARILSIDGNTRRLGLSLRLL